MELPYETVIVNTVAKVGSANFLNCKYSQSTKIHHGHNLLNKDGYLCIYNSKYLFSETNLFFNKKYEKVNTSHKNTGFVYKYHKNNEKINNNYPFFLFKKRRFKCSKV